MKSKKSNKCFLPILLTILLLFTSCSPQTSGTIEVEESDAEHTEAIQETATPTAAPTPEPTATPVPKVEGISFNEETGEVILSNFGEKVFSNCSDYEIITENEVSFYSEDLGTTCRVVDGAVYAAHPEYDIPIVGFMISQYPRFADKEAVLSYFIDQGDIVAKMMAEGKVVFPFNDDGSGNPIIFPDELKQHANEVFSIYTPEAIAAAEEIVHYQKDAMMANRINTGIADPFLHKYGDYNIGPFSYRNQRPEFIQDLMWDDSEGSAYAQSMLSAYKGVSLTLLLGAFYDGEISLELPQDEFTKYMNRFSEIAQAMEEFRFTYTQQSFDKAVSLVENNNCPLAVVNLAKMYWDRLPVYDNAMTPSGIVSGSDASKHTISYHGVEQSVLDIRSSFSQVMHGVALYSNFSNGSDFEKTFEKHKDQFPFYEDSFKE